MTGVGVYEIETVYDGDVVIDVVSVTMEELQDLDRSLIREVTPGVDRADVASGGGGGGGGGGEEERKEGEGGGGSKSTFNVPALIKLLDAELSTRRLVLR